jgi:hypothetical protein
MTLRERIFEFLFALAGGLGWLWSIQGSLR